MFLLSIKLTRTRAAVAIILLVVLVTLTVTGISNLSGREAAAVADIESGMVPSGSTAKTEEERIAFLEAFGWEVSTDNCEVREVIIPKEFDTVYLQYNELQQTQGCNLTRYAGKRCKRYTYTVVNHPSGEQPVYCHLLQYGNKIIGGDVCAAEQDGFMHGFKMES